jgi:hypothetical protein
MPQLLALDLPAPHGMLEALLRLPDPEAPEPRTAALICHPDPSGGGTMHNKVVFRIAQALGDLNMPTLRFNYRGVGRSTGVTERGPGERDDIRTALDALAARFPDLPLILAGFSFGSWLGLPIGCADERVTRLVGVGVPVRLLRTSALADCQKPKLIVQGEQDEYGPLPDLRAWFAEIPEPKRLEVVAGADHFFKSQQTQLYDAVRGYFAEQLAAD